MPRCPLVEVPDVGLWIDPSEPVVISIECGAVVVENIDHKWELTPGSNPDALADVIVRLVNEARAKVSP